MFPLIFFLLAVNATAKEKSPFIFAVPAGWINLSPGAPPKNIERVPKGLIQEMAGKKVDFYAVDYSAKEGVRASMVGIVIEKRILINEKLRDQYEDLFLDKLRKSGAKIDAYAKNILQIGDVQILRVEQNISIEDKKAQQLVYVMPGGKFTAMLNFSASPEVFTRYRPLFDATAHLTGGVQKNLLAFDEDDIAGLKKVLFLLAALVVGGLAKRWKRKKKGDAPPKDA